jgi:hypothetical protein
MPFSCGGSLERRPREVALPGVRPPEARVVCGGVDGANGAATLTEGGGLDLPDGDMRSSGAGPLLLELCGTLCAVLEVEL